jgi:hypothetical protein
METEEPKPAAGELNFINLLVFEAEDAKQVIGDLIRAHADLTDVSIPQKEQTVKLTAGHTQYEVVISQQQGVFVLQTSTLLGASSLDDSKNIDSVRDKGHSIITLFTPTPIVSLSVLVLTIDTEDQALKLVDQYSSCLGSPQLTVGRIADCLLATCRITVDKGYPLVKRELIIAPIKQDSLYADERRNVPRLILAIKQFVINLAVVAKLFELCKPYFPQVTPFEGEIAEMIETIMNRIKRREKLEPTTLKEWLGRVLDRSSTISILSGLMRRNQVTSRTYIEENRNTLDRWNEIGLKGYPTNTLFERVDYNNMLLSFEDFVERTQSLKTQLETASETIGMYLDIQQQEQSVAAINGMEKTEKLLKNLTWVVVLLTLLLILLEVAKSLNWLGA